MFLHMQKNPSDHFCCLDDVPIRCNKGEFVRLKHGMVVSLWKNFYRYKIECVDPSNAPLLPLLPDSSSSSNPTTVHAASESSDDDDEHDATSSNAIATIQNTARSNMVEECVCSVCMDIMVNAHVSNPCGHVFCIDCVKELKNCPNCRTHVTSWVGMKKLDGLILNMVKRGDFDEDDVNHFLTRMPHVTLSENEWKCIYSTRDNNIHPKSNTSNKRKQPNTKLAKHKNRPPIKNGNHRPKKKRRTHHSTNHPPNNNHNPQYLLSTTTSTSTAAAAATTTTLPRSPPPEVVAVVPATDRERGKRRHKRNRVPSSSTSVSATAAAIATTGTAPNDAICVD